ncbi:MAG: sensor histidine kinase [Planctomycetota bacterium]
MNLMDDWNFDVLYPYLIVFSILIYLYRRNPGMWKNRLSPSHAERQRARRDILETAEAVSMLYLIPLSAVILDGWSLKVIFMSIGLTYGLRAIVGFFDRSLLHKGERPFNNLFSCLAITIGIYAWSIPTTILALCLFSSNGRLWLKQMTLADARERELALGCLSHELRTPAASIRSLAGTLQSNPAMDESQKSMFLSLIVSETDRLSRGLERGLSIVRRKETPDIDRVPVDLAEWAEVACTRWSHQIPSLKVECSGKVPVLMDPERLDEALDVLLDNALRHGREPVNVSVLQEGGEAVIRVRDAGPGIPEPSRQSLLRRMEGDLEDMAESTDSIRGLGLWAASEVAKAHGGKLVLEEGSTITLRLPLQSSHG